MGWEREKWRSGGRNGRRERKEDPCQIKVLGSPFREMFCHQLGAVL